MKGDIEGFSPDIGCYIKRRGRYYILWPVKDEKAKNIADLSAAIRAKNLKAAKAADAREEKRIKAYEKQTRALATKASKKLTAKEYDAIYQVGYADGRGYWP